MSLLVYGKTFMMKCIHNKVCLIKEMPVHSLKQLKAYCYFVIFIRRRSELLYT